MLHGLACLVVTETNLPLRGMIIESHWIDWGSPGNAHQRLRSDPIVAQSRAEYWSIISFKGMMCTIVYTRKGSRPQSYVWIVRMTCWMVPPRCSPALPYSPRDILHNHAHSCIRSHTGTYSLPPVSPPTCSLHPPTPLSL
jgi:hypothetical protein